ncbi:MAG: (Fe-S)-binding protein, partial [Actinobacteria bacterium]|nr:(Fe-S)-binding protein [Actinomycetota bacterium]
MALKDFEADMESCCRCSACKFIPLEVITGQEYADCCPSISRYNWHSHSGGGRMAFGLGLIRGRVEYTPRTAEVIYNCNLCGACDVSCKYAMEFDVLEPLYAMREECVKSGQTVPVWDKLVKTMQKQGPLIVGATAKKGQWFKDLTVKDYAREKTGVIYHAGCLASYDKAAGKVAAAAVSLLGKAKIDVGIAKDGELCCGGRAYEMGYRDEALKQAELNVARFKESG